MRVSLRAPKTDVADVALGRAIKYVGGGLAAEAEDYSCARWNADKRHLLEFMVGRGRDCPTIGSRLLIRYPCQSHDHSRRGHVRVDGIP